MKASVITLDNAPAGEIELDEQVFGLPVRKDILARMVNWQLAKRRAGTHKTKGISDISGTTKKPYKQKGTGRARQGSIRASQWVGGGKAMAPKARDYSYRPPKKVRKGALCAALSMRAREKALVIVDTFDLESTKTKATLELLTKRLKLKDALVVDERKNTLLHRTVRNLADFDVLPPEGLNLESLLRRKALVLTSAAAQALNSSLEAR